MSKLSTGMAVLAVGTFALLTLLLSWVQWRFPRSRRVISGPAAVILKDGKPVEAVMKRHRVSLEDLLIAMREQGIRRTSDVEYVVLEANGKMSFFLFEVPEGSSGAPEKPSAS